MGPDEYNGSEGVLEGKPTSTHWYKECYEEIINARTHAYGKHSQAPESPGCRQELCVCVTYCIFRTVWLTNVSGVVYLTETGYVGCDVRRWFRRMEERRKFEFRAAAVSSERDGCRRWEQNGV